MGFWVQTSVALRKATRTSAALLKATSGTGKSHILWENKAFLFGHDNMVQVWQTDLKLWIWSCPNLEDAISIPTTAISNHEDAASLLSSAVNEAFASHSMESLDSWRMKHSGSLKHNSVKATTCSNGKYIHIIYIYNIHVMYIYIYLNILTWCLFHCYVSL